MNRLPPTYLDFLESKSYYKNLEISLLMSIVTTIKKSLHIIFVTVIMSIKNSVEC